MGGSGMVQRLGTTPGYPLVEMLMVIAIGLALMALAPLIVARAISSIRAMAAPALNNTWRAACSMGPRIPASRGSYPI